MSTYGQLAKMVRAVRSHPHGASTQELERTLEAIRGDDLGYVEWLCRLVSEPALVALERAPNTPLWGVVGGSGHPDQVVEAGAFIARAEHDFGLPVPKFDTSEEALAAAQERRERGREKL